MRRCIQLAENGLGHTSPNPLVGCVIVHDGVIIGEGYHRAYGKPHAEVHAIQSVANKDLLRQSTLYVNLEPCAHYGKTPPCSDLIVAMKIPRVVIGTVDSHSLVAGKGIERLRNAGIEVTTGVLQWECYRLNRRFFTYHEKKRPYIILKWAQSRDGRMDIQRMNHEKGIHWITGKDAKRQVHLWRSQEDAILVGTQTVRNDNPSLTVREIEGKNPVRLVWDRDLQLDLTYNVFNNDAATIVLNAHKTERLSDSLQLIRLDFDGDLLKELMHQLFQMHIVSMIVEGGADTLQRFIQADLWDEARVLTGDSILISGLQAPQLNLQPERTGYLGNDWVHYYSKHRY